MAEEEESPPEIPTTPETLPWYTSVSWQPFHYELYEKVYDLLLEKCLFFNSSSAREKPPYVFLTPEELHKEVDFSLPEKGEGQEQIMEYFEKLIAYSPHHSHPFYLSKYGTGLDPYTIAGDFMGSILSTAVLTYLFAPVFTLQEEIVEMNIRKLCGYPNPEHGDGVQVPGGGFATGMAIAAAMNFAFDDTRDKGFAALNGQNLAVFASENCNDFVEKGCMVAGLGLGALVKVGVDKNGRMNVNQLRQQVQRSKASGVQALVVVATIGTDPVGAVDPLKEIADYCEENHIWLHVDGTYAGPLLFSDKYRAEKLAGIEKSSSFILGGTGMLGMPSCYTTMVTPHDFQFFKTFGVGAEVVFEPTLLYDSVHDNGDHTVQTSRRPDIAKLWLLWQAKGRKGIANHIDYVMDLAFEFNEEVKRRPAFHAIMSQIDSTRVAFYYVPVQYRIFPRNTDYMNYTMSTLSRKIKNKLLNRGGPFLSLSKVKGYPECFAVSITNSTLSMEDLKYVLDQIDACGREIVGKSSSTSWTPMPVPRFLRNFFGPKKEEGIEMKDRSSPEPKAYGPPPPARDSYPSYVNSPIEELHLNFFKQMTKLLDAKGLYFQQKRDEPLLCFRSPEDLVQEFDLSLADEPKLQTDSDVVNAMANMIRYSIHQAHPFYVYQLLSGGLDPYTIMSDFIMATMTSNLLTYEEGPLYTLMEEEVVKACRKRIGLPEDGDGMLTPGGTIGNITAILVARLALFPEIKYNGLTGLRDRKLTIYISKNAHYCFQKGALLQGLGLDNVVAVEPDAEGRMDTNELKKAIAKTKSEGGTPFFVGNTAGTTVLGVFDNVQEISKICRENMWLHVDGSVGGASMFSDFQLEDKLKYCHLANSMNFNPHKWFGVTQELTVLMFRQKDIVRQTLGIGQDYREGGGPSSNSRSWISRVLRMTTTGTGGKDETRNYDSSAAFGDLAAHGGIGWDRRPTVIKFWLLWKTKGIEGLGKHIDYTYDNKDFLVEELKRPERQKMFRLVRPQYEAPGVCFYYLPEALRGLDENSEEFKNRVEKVALPLQARLVRGDVTITPIFRDNGSPLFTKFTMMSSGINKEDIKYLLDAIDFHGKDLPV